MSRFGPKKDERGLYPEQAEKVEWIATRLTKRQRTALAALGRPEQRHRASEIGVFGPTLMSLNDFRRGERGIEFPLILASYEFCEPDGGRVWSITDLGLAALSERQRLA